MPDHRPLAPSRHAHATPPWPQTPAAARRRASRRMPALAAALTLVLAGCAGLAGPALADGSAGETRAQAEALATFAAARGGDEGRIAPAVVQLQALSQAAPGHPLWLAYAGAATAMQARTTWQPWKKMAYAEDGLALLDKALALLTPAHMNELHRQVPVALETRLTAASTFLALPAMFQRGERGRRLLAQVQADPALAGTPARFQEAVRQLAATVQP
ncbi:MAG: hypothetical protein L6Q75_15945 [Burkholderiaceae bacterium]|nr:hypothetical protein [Burkholderiaceae bacterium]